MPPSYRVQRQSESRKDETDLATYADLIAEATARLRGRSESPRLDAEVLFRHVAGLDRTGLFLSLQEEASANQVAQFKELVHQRIAGQPVAYLTGHREFMGLEFHVTPDVLIPRPETELLVEWALSTLETMQGHPIKVVDVGAGSGAIAISVVAMTPGNATTLAIEPSAAARDVIAHNADNLLDDEQRSRFSVTDGDLLLHQTGRFGMVLANLPYLTPAQITGNLDLTAEPRMALDGGADGLDLVNRLIAQLSDCLAEKCAVGLEIDPSQSTSVRSALASALPGATIDVIRDLASFDRHVVATW